MRFVSDDESSPSEGQPLDAVGQILSSELFSIRGNCLIVKICLIVTLFI